MNSVFLLRAEFYARAAVSGSADYLRANRIDPAMVEARGGVLGICPVRFFKSSRFDFADDGEPAAVIEAFDADDETVLDLVAWPISQPEAFARALGVADGLGLARVRDPATYLGNRPLMVFKTPLAWLRAGGVGAVILNPHSAPRWLPDAPFIAGEDLEHARRIARRLHPYFPPQRILAPLPRAA